MIEPHKTLLHINQGGLMRCCLQSLLDASFTSEDDGEIYVCPHCHTQMIVLNQQWQWNPEDSEY